MGAPWWIQFPIVAIILSGMWWLQHRQTMQLRDVVGLAKELGNSSAVERLRELQKAVGELTRAHNVLSEKVAVQSVRVDRLERHVSRARQRRVLPAVSGPGDSDPP